MTDDRDYTFFRRFIPLSTFHTPTIMTQPARAFTRALLSDLHTWWLKDVPTQHDASIPKSAFQRWFMQSSELDEKCWYVLSFSM
jgi:hypothetical protein